MASSHHWRRRRATAALYLAIMDHDNRRYTIERPVDSGNDWINEIFRANKSGRRIDFYWIENENTEFWTGNAKNYASNYERWPSKSIIIPLVG
jgi:hypothetical protein